MRPRVVGAFERRTLGPFRLRLVSFVDVCQCSGKEHSEGKVIHTAPSMSSVVHGANYNVAVHDW